MMMTSATTPTCPESVRARGGAETNEINEMVFHRQPKVHSRESGVCSVARVCEKIHLEGWGTTNGKSVQCYAHHTHGRLLRSDLAPLPARRPLETHLSSPSHSERGLDVHGHAIGKRQ